MMPETLTQTKNETSLTFDQAKDLAAEIKYKNPLMPRHDSSFAVCFSMGEHVGWSDENPQYIFLRYQRPCESEFRDHLTDFLTVSQAGDFEQIGDYIIIRKRD